MKTNALLALTLSLLSACAAFADPDAIDLPDAVEGSGVGPGGTDTGTDAGGTLPDGTPIGPDGLPVVGSLLGDSCTASTPCRTNLACVDATCQPVANRQLGESCIVSGECAAGLVCGTTSQCFEAGDGGDGSPCTQAQDCGSAAPTAGSAPSASLLGREISESNAPPPRTALHPCSAARRGAVCSPPPAFPFCQTPNAQTPPPRRAPSASSSRSPRQESRSPTSSASPSPTTSAAPTQV